MQGSVLSTGQTNCLVLGDDGVRYTFASQEWRGTSPPQVGARVQFQLRGSVAVDVYPLLESSPQRFAVPPNVPPQQAAPPSPMPTAESSFGQQTAPSGPATTQPTGLPWLLIGSIAGVALVLIAVAFALGMFIASNSPNESEQSEAVSTTPAQVATEVPIRTEPTKSAVATPSSSVDKDVALVAETPAINEMPVTVQLDAGESGVLEHNSGAWIEVPEGALIEAAVISITEVEPPESPLDVRRAFDFSVDGSRLGESVTIYMPLVLGPGEHPASMYALHWNETAEGWEPVPGTVDEENGTIAVTTDHLSIFSYMYTSLDASCEVSPETSLGSGAFNVTAAGTSLTSRWIDIYMEPSVVRPGDGSAPEGRAPSRSDVFTVGFNRSFELATLIELPEHGQYRVGCRLFRIMRTTGKVVELLASEPPSTIVTVGGAELRIERVYDDEHTIYVDQTKGMYVDVRNAGDERSGRFNLAADFISSFDGKTTRFYRNQSTLDDLVVGDQTELDAGATADGVIGIDLPKDFESGEYRVCARIEPLGFSPDFEIVNPPDEIACLDRYVLPAFEGAMRVSVSPVYTDTGHIAWVAGPWDSEMFNEVISKSGIEDEETLKSLYKGLAGELAFRRAVTPGDDGRHVFLQGLTEAAGDVRDTSEIAEHILKLCFDSGLNCETALEISGLPKGLFNALPDGALDTAGGVLLFGDVYFSVLMNQALDLEQALNTLDELETLPLGPVWEDAVREARVDVEKKANEDFWIAFAAEVVEERDEIMQLALTKITGGLVKGELLRTLSFKSYAVLAKALGVKVAAGTGVAVGAAPAALIVAAVWFASEVYITIQENEERAGLAALAAFLNAAHADPYHQGDLREATAYAKYVFYDNLYEINDEWIRILWSRLSRQGKVHQDDQSILAQERDKALAAVNEIVSARSVVIVPDSIEVSVGETAIVPVRSVSFSGKPISSSAMTWTTDAPEIATVSDFGVISGVAPGETVVAVQALNGEFAAVPVKVNAGADSAFQLDWDTSATAVEVGESFDVSIRMYDPAFAGEHGGISVSFPLITESGGSTDRHISSIAEVEVLSYTSGTSNVTFHQPGATIYHRAGNEQFPADYLLVESDDPSWSRSDDRTLRLRITPKQTGEFPILVRGWLCVDGYTDCWRNPASGRSIDMQGWPAEQLLVHVVRAEPTAVLEPEWPMPFQIDWDASATDVEVGESIELSIRMHDSLFAGEHGGISVSFPSLFELSDSSDGYSSYVAEVQAVSYTSGLSKVAFHQPGATIYHRVGNQQFPADYLLVESDDSSWTTSDDRTLRLRITPKRAGEFPILIRGWLCVDGYTDCSRNPESAGTVDQQGWDAIELTFSVASVESSKDAPSALLKASFQNFRVIYVEFDDPDNPDLGCYSLLGNRFRRADWEDLKEFYASGGSIEELIAGLRWEDEKAGSSGGVRHPRVSREGAITWNGRHYFVSRHDHVPPGYFLVHDDIDDRHLSLGSWYGEDGSEVLCYGTG